MVGTIWLNICTTFCMCCFEWAVIAAHFLFFLFSLPEVIFIVLWIAETELRAVFCKFLFVLVVIFSHVKAAGIVINITILPSLYLALIPYISFDSTCFALASPATCTHVEVHHGNLSLVALAANLIVIHGGLHDGRRSLVRHQFCSILRCV